MRIRAFLTALLVLFLVTGCIIIHTETKVKRDGSGTKSIVLAVDKTVLSMIESLPQEPGANGKDIWEAARVGATSIEGVEIEDYSDDKAEGIKVSIPFASLEELQTLGGSDPFEGTDVVTVNQDKNVTTLIAVVNTRELKSGFEETEGQNLEGFDLADIDIEYIYTVEVEGKILEYSPKENAKIEGSKVTWDLTLEGGESATLVVKWQTSGGINTLTIGLAAVVLAAIVLVLTRIAMTVRNKKRADRPTVV